MASCDQGTVFEPVGTRFSIDLSGRLLDGRNLDGNGVSGQVAVFAADGRTPVPIDVDNILETDSEGRFSGAFEAVLTEPVILLRASASAPFLTTSKAFELDGGAVEADLYLSSTLITGHIMDPNGAPAVVDIWVMRDDGTGNFTPYEIAGGRDFIPPLPPSGVNFAVDSDVLGRFTVPVRIPDATFRLVLVVDRKTDVFESFLTDIIVTGGQDNMVPNITLQWRGPPASAEGGAP
ncbi:MAG: hypothetical protein ACE5JR_04920 [Gemmatimonadota bacterium]